MTDVNENEMSNDVQAEQDNQSEAPSDTSSLGSKPEHLSIAMIRVQTVGN